MKKSLFTMLVALATLCISASANAQTIDQIPIRGQKGENVKVIQSQLTQKGFPLGTVDGQFGGKTVAALTSFQTKNNLQIHGLVDLPTLEKLGITFSPKIHENGYMPLSWESVNTTNKVWSDYTFKIIEGLFDDFDKCQDITRIRPDYKSLSKPQKINVWGELISAIALPESGWKPTSWMNENFTNLDSVTGLPVKSEGLLQLSYQDKKSYPKLPCRFDWNADKTLAVDNPQKTIFNPEINLEFGINILADQIRKQGKVILTSNVYWAVIKENGKFQKITQITTMVRNLKF
jgi:uncharacterized protein YdbL (DUF1318 family)